MKYFYKIISTLIFLLISCFSLYAQSPDGVNYQAALRDNAGDVLSGEAVTVRFTIHQTTASGTTVFQETQATTTNQFGLVNLVIGSVNTTDFPLINWSTGTYFLQIEVDAGAGFDDLGATQLMSVPYALYAETSGTGAPGLNSLLDTSTVSLATCPNGGKRVVMGLDANSNAVLDAAEITSSFIVCNGEAGTDGLSINWLGQAGNPIPSPNANDAYYNTSAGVSYIYNGTTATWDTLAAGGSGSADADWVINGNEMYTDPSITGHIGVGTNTPLKKLHIESSFSGGDGILINSNTATGDPGIGFQTQGTSQFVLGVDQSDNNKFKIGTSAVGINSRLVIDNRGRVGIGNTDPPHQLTVFSTDTTISSFTGSNATGSVIAVLGLNPNAFVGSIFRSSSDSLIVGLNPTDKTAYVTNTTPNGHLIFTSDSTIVSYAEAIGNLAQGNIYNTADTIFNTNASGHIYNVNAGTYYTDSLYVLGNNSTNSGYVLANDGFGQAKWTDPSSLSGGSLWQSNTPDIYFNTGKVGIGTTTPSSHLEILGELKTDSIIITNGAANGKVLTSNASGFGTWQLPSLGAWSSNGVETVLTNSSDLVGIGNNSPGALLDVGPSANALTIRGVNTNATNGVAGYFKNTAAANTAAALFVKVASTTAPAITLSTLGSTTLRMERTNATAFDWELTANNTGFHIKGGTDGTAGALTDFLNVDGNGNVGIGTSIPSAKLDVVGMFKLTDGTQGAGKILTSDGVGNATWQLPTVPASLWTQGTGNDVYNSTDSVGIGTTNPSHLFEINKSQTTTAPLAAIINNSTGDAALRMTAATTDYMIGVDNSDNTFKIAKSSTNLGLNTMMVIGTTGNFGFSVTAPIARLDANGFGGTALNLTNSSATTATMRVINNSGGPAATFTNGNVGIGIANPTVRFEVLDQVSAGAAIKISNTRPVGTDGSIALFENSGERTVTHSGVVINNLVTKIGGSSNSKTGLEVNSTGAWGVSTANQPNVGIKVNVSGADNNYALQLKDGSEGSGKILTSDAAGNASWQLPAPVTSFWNGSAGYIELALPSDNVGLGLSSPAAKLHIHSTSGIGNLRFTSTSTGIANTDGFSITNDGSTNLIMQQHENADWYFSTNGGTTAMTIKPTGNVGIGTTTPSTSGNFTVESQASKFIALNLTGGSGVVLAGSWSSTTLNPQVRYKGVSAGFIDIGQDATGNFVIEGNDTPRLTVMQTGNVGIGTTTPSQKLDVDGGGSIEVDGDYTYETPRMDYYVVAAAGFNASAGSSAVNVDGDIYGSSRWFTGGTLGATEYMYAPVHLPNDAKVSRVDFYVYDADAAYQVSGELYFNTLGSSAYTSMATTNGSGATSATGDKTLTDVSISNFTIDNSVRSYYLRFKTSQNNSNLKVYGAKITYTVTKAN